MSPSEPPDETYGVIRTVPLGVEIATASPLLWAVTVVVTMFGEG